MIMETLSRLREGLSEKRFTMQALYEKSGVPVPTIADMKRSDWSSRTLDNIQKIAAVIDEVDPKPATEDEQQLQPTGT